MRRSKGVWVFTYGVLIAWTLVLLFPMYWVVTTSIKTRPAISGGATFVPWLDFEPSLQAWRELFSRNVSDWRKYFANSLVVSLATAALATVFGLMGG